MTTSGNVMTNEPSGRSTLTGGVRIAYAVDDTSDTMTLEAYAQFCRALDQFNAAAFFECHETLESLWLADASPNRRLFQGIIQLAAAFVHWQRHQFPGILTLLDAGIAKLAEFPDTVLGVDLAGLRAQAVVARHRFQAGPGALDRFTVPDLPRIRQMAGVPADLAAF